MFRLDCISGNKPVFYFFIFLTVFSLKAQQNLVPNGDFEYYTQCPDDYGQINRAYPWYNPNLGSSDYYHTCVTAPGMFLDVRVPQNSFGFQFPHSGDGYGGLGTTINTLNYYEYVATPLIKPLVDGEDYCVSFWISPSDSSCLNVNKLGVYFSVDSIFSNIDYHISVLPQIAYTEFIFEKEDWILIESSFIAEGGEYYMAIGTFDTTGIELFQTCQDSVWSGQSYYFIDDVVVQLATESCNSEQIDIPNVFTPNGDGLNDVWKLESKLELEVVIINRWGNVVFEQTANTIEWKAENVTEGVYYYSIKTKQRQKTGFIQLIR